MMGANSQSASEVGVFAEEWLTVLALYEADDVVYRQIVYRIRELAFGRLYKREREEYREWIDRGGEGGEG